MSEDRRRRPEDFDEALRERIEAQLADVMPDFEDMMRRAEQRDESDLDAFEPSSPTSHPTAEEDAKNRRALHPYVSAYKGRLDAKLAVVSTSTREDEAQRRRRAWWLGLMAAAALLLAWVGASAGLGSQRSRQPQPSSTALDEAKAATEPDAATRSHSRGQSPRAPSSSRLPAQELAESEPLPEPAAPPTRVAPPAKPPKKTPKSIDERLATLDAAAQAAWRKGDKRGAVRKFQAIVDIGGRRPAVELAFGELFSLNRQLGESPTKLWRAYLTRFPRGRYAEDAKAGLCRRASGLAGERCWSQYAEAFPGGAHLEEATKAFQAERP